MPAIHFLAYLSYSSAPINGEKYHYYPTGLEMFALSSAAGNAHAWPDKGGVRNKYGYQGQEHERHFALHLNEFEARHYACPDEGGDPQSARWMVPDPANQFASPYVGMGNAWVNSVDPDGRIFVPILVGALLFGGGNLAIQANKGNVNSFSDGLIAFGKGAAIGAAVGATFGKFALAKGWGIAGAAKAPAVHATQQGALLAKEAFAVKATASATKASVFFGGALNVVNSYNPESGIGWHTLGHFAAGAAGTYMGITDGGLAGFFTGGVLNMSSDIVTGQVENTYGAAQSFVGGGLSAMAGRSFYKTIANHLHLPKIGNPEARAMGKFQAYGLQNVASNFAYDSRQEFFEKPLAIHGAAFMVGGIGASVQGAIMDGRYGNSALGRFSARIGLSTSAYFAEYVLNYYFKTKMEYVRYSNYQANKAASYAIKSWAYSWLYSF